MIKSGNQNINNLSLDQLKLLFVKCIDINSRDDIIYSNDFIDYIFNNDTYDYKFIRKTVIKNCKFIDVNNITHILSLFSIKELLLFIESYKYKLNNNIIEEIIKLNYDDIILYKKLCIYQNINEELIIKYIDKLDINNIICYQKISFDFIEYNKNLIKNWDNLFENKYLDINILLDKYSDKIDININHIDCSKYIELNNLIKYKNIIKWNYYFRSNVNKKNFENVLLNDQLIDCNTLNLILIKNKFNNKLLDKLSYKITNWDNISYYQKLSTNFIIKYDTKLNFNIISKHQYLNESVIKLYANKICWDKIACYQKLSEKFIIDNKINIKMYKLLFNQHIINNKIDIIKIYNLNNNEIIILFDYLILNTFKHYYLLKLYNNIYNLTLNYILTSNKFDLKKIKQFDIKFNSNNYNYDFLLNLNTSQYHVYCKCKNYYLLKDILINNIIS